MTWPTSDVTTTSMDAGTDTPPRAEFLSWAQKFNQMRAHVSAFMQGLLGSADAAAARTTLDVPSRSGGNASGTWGIAISGNAATATRLATARTIGGVSFDGSASINLPGVNTTGNQNTTGTAAALSTASGAAPSYAARAWVNFNGTGTVAIRAGGNVSSITDNGTGDFTMNFATAMPDANYAASGNVSGSSRDSLLSFGDDDGPSQPVSFTASSLRFYVQNGAGTLVDPGVATVVVFR